MNSPHSLLPAALPCLPEGAAPSAPRDGLPAQPSFLKLGTRNPARLVPQAFSLIEVALSIAIIGMGLIAILGVMPNLLNSSRSAVESTELAMAAQNSVDMDFVVWRSPQNLFDNWASSDNSSQLYVGPSLRASNYIAYAASTNALSGKEYAEKDGTGKPLLRTVRYVYTWPPGAARPQTFTFITEICATTNIVMQ